MRYPNVRAARTVFFAFAAALAVAAAPPALAESLEADLSVASYDLVVGQSFVARILLYPSEPGESSLSIGNLPRSFSPRSSRRERRFLERIGEFSPERVSATLFEGEWVALEPGTHTVGPFTLRYGAEELVLPAVTVTVTDPLPGEYRHLGWRARQGVASVGKKTRIALEAYFSGELTGVVCPASEGALLETVFLASPGLRPDARDSSDPPGPDESARPYATVAEFDWTPLVAGTVRLPAASVEFRSRDGSIARLYADERSLVVSPSARAPLDRGKPSASADMDTAFRDTGEAGADKAAALPPLLRRQSDDPSLRKAAALWDARETARALAEIRRAEYRSLLPFGYTAIRREAEKALGFESSASVPPAAWKHVSVIGAILLACGSLATRLFALARAGDARDPERGHERTIRAAYAVALLASLGFACFAVYAYASDSRPAAVVLSGELKRVPENESSVAGVLSPGETVRVYGRSEGWLFVRNRDAISGWLKPEQVDFYAGGGSP